MKATARPASAAGLQTAEKDLLKDGCQTQSSHNLNLLKGVMKGLCEGVLGGLLRGILGV